MWQRLFRSPPAYRLKLLTAVLTIALGSLAFSAAPATAGQMASNCVVQSNAVVCFTQPVNSSGVLHVSVSNIAQSYYLTLWDTHSGAQYFSSVLYGPSSIWENRSGTWIAQISCYDLCANATVWLANN